MPIEPVDSSKKTDGDGQEKYPAKPKHGPGKFDEILDKAEKAQKARSEINSMAEKTRSEPKYTGKAYSDTGPRTGPTSGGFGSNSGAAELKSITNPRAMKSGGKVSSASKRADGCCIRGKTKA
jgi:hypothetical protein